MTNLELLLLISRACIENFVYTLRNKKEQLGMESDSQILLKWTII